MAHQLLHIFHLTWEFAAGHFPVCVMRRADVILVDGLWLSSCHHHCHMQKHSQPQYSWDTVQPGRQTRGSCCQSDTGAPPCPCRSQASWCFDRPEAVQEVHVPSAPAHTNCHCAYNVYLGKGVWNLWHVHVLEHATDSRRTKDYDASANSPQPVYQLDLQLLHLYSYFLMTKAKGKEYTAF